MNSLEEFIARNNPAGKSKLDSFADDIIRLKGMGYSENDILRYLDQVQNLKVSKRTLNGFINRRKKSVLQETVCEPLNNAGKGAAKNADEANSEGNGKLQWPPAISRDDLY